MKRAVAACVVAAALAACSKAGDAEGPGTGARPPAELAAPAAPVATPEATPNATPGAMAFERARVTEADLGVRLYPGAMPQPDGMARVTTPEGISVMAEYRSADPVAKVAAFYREQLRERSEGNPFLETSDAGSVGLTLTDSRSGAMFVVGVEKLPNGSSLRIMTTRPVVR